MKPEVTSSSITLDVVVTPDMAASLDGKIIHPLYATFWLAYHAEVAARKAIEPFFDPGENAIGSAITLEHCAMCPLGARVLIHARVDRVHDNRIVCAITAYAGATLIARGTQTQIVLPDTVIDERIKQLYTQSRLPLPYKA